jgi:hypothetical protein
MRNCCGSTVTAPSTLKFNPSAQTASLCTVGDVQVPTLTPNIPTGLFNRLGHRAAAQYDITRVLVIPKQHNACDDSELATTLSPEPYASTVTLAFPIPVF